VRVGRPLAGLLQRIVGWWLGTLRVARVGRRRVDALRAAGQPVVYALWHADHLLLLQGHAHDDCVVLVSMSADGALLAGLLDQLGYGVVRGSSSRGAVAGWRGLRRALRAGAAPTLAVDGPRGPAESVAGGAIALAAASGAALVPVAASARREVRLKTWDRTRIPWPGSRAVVVYGRPILLAPDADRERARGHLATRLRSLGRTARRLAR
jgi:lysophospholipid acyltransferase (LPLAT)-like uncharacterized protein